LFVTENINLLGKFSTEEILAENTKLVNMSQMVKGRLESDYDKKELHEAISYLIFKENTPYTIQESTKRRMDVISHINKNITKVVTETPEVPTSLIANIAVDKFNEKYADLTEDEHKVLNVILEAGNDVGKEEVFKNTIKSCVDSVNERLQESSNKEKLLNVKERLLSTDFISETFSDDISKLLELKRTLTTE
jgi:hypothetical protein